MRSCAASGHDELFRLWSPEADESLQAILGRVGERSDLVRVAREIDFWLARAPLDFGESRFDTVRLGVVPPLAVLFDVLDDPPTVIVLDIWTF
jgi:hypothetical protein